jgi:hypothetical protein
MKNWRHCWGNPSDLVDSAIYSMSFALLRNLKADGTYIFIPEGCLRIAQRFNVGCRTKMSLSPEGTAEPWRAASAVPFGTRSRSVMEPNVETLGYYQLSLRDKVHRTDFSVAT